MRINREDLVAIRKKTIKLLPEVKSGVINMLTEALINYPSMVEVETDYRDLKFGVKKEIVSAGYGAFGERESDVYYRINGVSVYVEDAIFLDAEEKPLCVLRLNLSDLVKELQEAHNNSFDIKL